MKSIGCENGWMNMEQSAKYHEKYPLLTRDNGAEILELIDQATGRVFWIHDSSDFAGDSLFCEWAYVIDFDKKTFEIYQGFNHSPLPETDRFYSLTEQALKDREGREAYYPVRHLKTYSLDELPTKEVFLEEMKVLTEHD